MVPSLSLLVDVPENERPHAPTLLVVDQAPPAAQDDLAARQDDAFAADVPFLPTAILPPLHEADALPPGDILHGGDGMQVAADLEFVARIDSLSGEVMEVLAGFGGLQGSGTLLGGLHSRRGRWGREILPFFLELFVKSGPGFRVRGCGLVDRDPLAPLVLLHVPVVDRVGRLGVLGGEVVGEFARIILGLDPVDGPLLEGFDQAHARGGFQRVVPGAWPGAVEHLYRAKIKFEVDEAVVETEMVVDQEAARVAIGTEVVDLLARE